MSCKYEILIHRIFVSLAIMRSIMLAIFLNVISISGQGINPTRENVKLQAKKNILHPSREFLTQSRKSEWLLRYHHNCQFYKM